MPSDPKAAADALVGKTWGTDVTEDDVKAIATVHRILIGDQMMTMDYREERLNVQVKEDTKVITGVNWG